MYYIIVPIIDPNLTPKFYIKYRKYLTLSYFPLQTKQLYKFKRREKQLHCTSLIHQTRGINRVRRKVATENKSGKEKKFDLSFSMQ